MRKPITMACLFLLLLVVLTGCWNRRELNELAIAVAMGVDKKDNDYLVSIQIVNPGAVAAQRAGTDTAPVITYSTQGTSIFEALRRTTTKSPRKIYLSHMQVIVLGKEVAEEGIAKVLDFLSRDHEFRTDFFLVVSKDATAEEILKTLTLLEKIPANKMFHSLESSNTAWAATGKATLDKLISDMTSEGKHPVLTGITLDGAKDIAGTKENMQRIDSRALLRYEGLAVFKKDKLVGWLNEEESKGYNYIQNEVKSTAEYVACPNGGNIALEIIRTNSEMKGKVVRKKPEVAIEVRVEANISEVQCNMDLAKDKTIRGLEAKAAEKIKGFMQQAISKAQHKYKADIFGFGEAVHRAEPGFWKKAKQNWDEEFVGLDVDMRVDFNIRGLGTISNSYLETKEE